MSRFGIFYRELRQRRVIRTAVVYVALVWGALQVADLLAEADFLSDRSVRWMILAALVGFPVTVILSWFYETPWRERHGLSVLGDVAVILAVAVGVAMLAWQQYFTSFARPTLAVLSIEATDTREDTSALGEYLAGRLRATLATRPELAVTELTSSRHPALGSAGMAGKARALQADLLLTGTLNQGAGKSLRLSLQLFNAEGELTWSAQFDRPLEEMASLESDLLAGAWSALPLPPETLETVRRTLLQCHYPSGSDAIRTLVHAERRLVEPDQAVQQLSALIEPHADSGLLHLARARAFFAQRETAPPARQPVYYNLGMQDLDQYQSLCPGQTAARLERVHQNPGALSTLEETKAFVHNYPSDAPGMLAFAGAWLEAGKPDKAMATARSAWQLDPLNGRTACATAVIFQRSGQPALGDELLARTAESAGFDWVSCEQAYPSR